LVGESLALLNGPATFIRRLTADRRSLDDVMRLAIERYSGERGFRPEEFQATASEVAGSDLSPLFHSLLATTEELDYVEASTGTG
jgi:predicted metalloprotease with PDZ domain